MVRTETHRLGGILSVLVLSVASFSFAAACMSCGGGDARDPCDPSSAMQMEVRHGEQSAVVDLGGLTGQRRGDLCLVPLDRIVDEADLDIDLQTSLFDFEGDDGFRPSQVDCAPLDGATLSKGWADMSSGTLVWDQELGLRGCYSVTGAKVIFALDPQ